MQLPAHAAFIIAAYAAAILIMIGLIGWVFADYRTQKRVLGELETRGLRKPGKAA